MSGKYDCAWRRFGNDLACRDRIVREEDGRTLACVDYSWRQYASVNV